MARYIKANKLVAAYLHLESDRNSLKDGNYLLWQQDMLAFGPLPMLNETLVMIGGIALLPHEAREEQDGTVLRPLPVATDERFILPETKTAESAEGETPSDENGEGTTETTSEEAETPSDENGEGTTETTSEEAETPSDENGEGTTETPSEAETTEDEGTTENESETTE